MVGLFLIGFGGAFTSIGSYQEMLVPFIQQEDGKEDKELTEELTDLLSGLYNASASLGAIIGPVAGSYIMIATDSFRKCSDYFSTLTLSFTFLLLVAVYLPNALKGKRAIIIKSESLRSSSLGGKRLPEFGAG